VNVIVAGETVTAPGSLEVKLTPAPPPWPGLVLNFTLNVLLDPSVSVASMGEVVSSVAPSCTTTRSTATMVMVLDWQSGASSAHSLSRTPPTLSRAAMESLEE